MRSCAEGITYFFSPTAALSYLGKHICLHLRSCKDTSSAASNSTCATYTSSTQVSHRRSSDGTGSFWLLQSFTLHTFLMYTLKSSELGFLSNQLPQKPWRGDYSLSRQTIRPEKSYFLLFFAYWKKNLNKCVCWFGLLVCCESEAYFIKVKFNINMKIMFSQWN